MEMVKGDVTRAGQEIYYCFSAVRILFFERQEMKETDVFDRLLGFSNMEAGLGNHCKLCTIHSEKRR